MSLPPRSADTMSDAIALSSPSGRMSKRAREAASMRLRAALFGEHPTREDFTGRDLRDARVIRIERIDYRIRDLRQFCARKLTSKRPNAVNREMAALVKERAGLVAELAER